VVDYLWYRRKVKGAYPDSLGFDVIDEWGRMIPDPDRWPSSKGGKGFTEVAKKVHNRGLKFGIHVMRGISTQAVNANTPILDTISVLLCIPSIAHNLENKEKRGGGCFIYYSFLLKEPGCTHNLKFNPQKYK
jgi:hypothetical protein